MISSNKFYAYAKVNLSLDIVGRRNDGYHFLRTIMQTISLADTVSVQLIDGETTVICDNPAIPSGESNICHKAVQAFAKRIKRPELSASIMLEKRIPHGAGMGGGSADCAAVLNALNELCEKPLSQGELITLGATLGADVPFCLVGGTCLCEGIGEVITPLPALPACFIVVAKSGYCVSTADAFAKYDKSPQAQRIDIDGQISALQSGSLRGVAAKMNNVFEVLNQCSQIDGIKSIMREYGTLGSMLTGSGSAVYGLFDNEVAAKACENELAKTAQFTSIATPVFPMI